MTKHTSNWITKPNLIHIESWKEIYLLCLIKKAIITQKRNILTLTINKDYYQRIIKL